MEHNKYKELKGELARLEGKFTEQSKLMNGSLLVFKDLDSQVQTLKDFLIESKIMTEEQYNERVDARRGLRLLGPSDVISVGDIVWVDYKASIEGVEVGADAGLPIRVGSGAINFELALCGHSVGETVGHSSVIQEEGEFKGKEVLFEIKINKAKTKIVEEKQDATGAGDTGADTVGTNDDAGAEVRGPGHEEQHAGADSVVLEGREHGTPGVNPELSAST
jgi:hypothetical protein